MFGILKKKLKESVQHLTRIAREKEEEPGPEKAKPAKKERIVKKVEEKPEPVKAKAVKKIEEAEVAEPEKVAEPEEPVEPEEHAEPAEEKPRSRLGFVKKFREKEFSGREIDDFFTMMEPELLQANLALEVMDFFRTRLKEMLVGKPVKRKDAERVIRDSFRQLLLETVDQGKTSIRDAIKAAKSEKRPACMVFLGYNGSGKTTTIAKIASRLLRERHKPVLAAADTFRAASIEQLEFHGGKLGINVIKHKYGADPAAVVFDARQHAASKGLDIVLADTAGRMHTNVNLMDELKKITRVNSPDLKILVVDSLTGNDVVHQVRKFDEGVGIDGLVLTKMDVNEKGGSIISACHIAKKPVMFIGTGQGYDDLQEFEPERFVDQILG
jgi:fused signal recognition particle receptor